MPPIDYVSQSCGCGGDGDGGGREVLVSENRPQRAHQKKGEKSTAKSIVCVRHQRGKRKEGAAEWVNIVRV